MKPETALYQLKKLPQEFLTNNRITIAGGSRSESTAMKIYARSFQRRPGGPNEYFAIGNTVVSPVGTVHPFQAHNVRMIKKTDPLDFGAIERYELTTTVDYMVTGQLTACAFAVLNDGGTIVVAHIQPDPGGERGAGPQLKIKLENEGRFAGSPTALTRVFGVPEYPAAAYVIGVRRGNWEIYAQVVSNTGEAGNVIDVVKII